MRTKQKTVEGVKAVELAALLGATPRTVFRWRRERGFPGPDAGGCYDLRAVLRWLAADRRKAAGISDTEREAKLRLIQERVLKVKQDRLTAASKLLPADEVKGEFARMATEIRTAMLILPAQTAPRLAGKTEAEIVQILDDDIRAALTALADGTVVSHSKSQVSS